MKRRGKWDGEHCWHRSSQERDSLCCIHSLRQAEFAHVEWLSDKAREREAKR